MLYSSSDSSSDIPYDAVNPDDTDSGSSTVDSLVTLASQTSAGQQTEKKIGTIVGGLGTGAAIGSAIEPGLGTIIGGVVGGVVGVVEEVFGSDTPSAMTKLWTPIPASVIRITGGHGKWTDTVTGQTMDDGGTDNRKNAVIVSSVGIFNSAGEGSADLLYDRTTGSQVYAEDFLSRWLAKFGNVTFAQAFAAQPSAFQVYGSNPANDPPHTFNAGTVTPASGAGMGGAASTPASGPGAVLGVNSPPIPLPTTATGAGSPTAVAKAPIVNTPWYQTTGGMVALAAVALGALYFFAKRR